MVQRPKRWRASARRLRLCLPISRDRPARSIVDEGLQQDWIGIDGLTFPPTFVGTEPINREMELRSVWCGIPCRTDVPNHLAARNRHPFAEPGRITVQMRI